MPIAGERGVRGCCEWAVAEPRRNEHESSKKPERKGNGGLCVPTAERMDHISVRCKEKVGVGIRMECYFARGVRARVCVCGEKKMERGKNGREVRGLENTETVGFPKDL